MVELNHNEIHHLTTEKTISIQAVSSGVHTGSSNWVMSIEGEQNTVKRYGLMTHSCLEGDFRYPRSIDKRSMNDIDCLIMSSTVLVDRVVERNLTSDIKEQYSNQILPLLDKLNEIMNSSANAKVLMPV